jgi:UDP-glucose 6-dehydrogenase
MTGPLCLTGLGTGCLGTSHSACLAGVEFDTLSVDTDARKVDRLNAARMLIYEPGLRELPCSGLDSGRLALTTSYPRAAAFGDVHSSAPTPCRSRQRPRRPVPRATLVPLLDRPCL